MPDVSQVLNAAQYIAPGFMFVQVLYLLGVARERSDFEMVGWSVILSVPIHWGGTQFITLLGLEFTQSLTFEVYLLAVALAGGLVVVFINNVLFFEDVATED